MNRGFPFFRASSTDRTTRIEASAATSTPSFSAARLPSAVSGSSSHSATLLMRYVIIALDFSFPSVRQSNRSERFTFPGSANCEASYPVADRPPTVAWPLRNLLPSFPRAAPRHESLQTPVIHGPRRNCLLARRLYIAGPGHSHAKPPAEID